MPETVNVYVDGSVRKEKNEDSKGYAGIGIYSYDNESLNISQSVDVLMTNNEAEYSALIYLFEQIVATEGYHYNIMMDSELVVKQVNKEWPVKAKNLKLFNETFWRVAEKLHHSVTFTVMKVNRNSPDQMKANDLAQSASAHQRIVGVKCVPEGTVAPVTLVETPDLGTDHVTPLSCPETATTEVKPGYVLHHDPLTRLVRVYQHLLDEKTGRSLEGSGPAEVLCISEEMVIQLIFERQTVKAKTPDIE